MFNALIALALLAPQAAETQDPVIGTPCFHAIGKLVGDLESHTYDRYGVETAVIVSGNAYAESAKSCGEDCTATGHGALAVTPGSRASKTAIGGTSEVAVPGFSEHALTFLLFGKNGKARLRWTVRGKTFESNVDSCTGGLWTSAQGSKSAIVISFAGKNDPA